jgi:hypothetical protein
VSCNESYVNAIKLKSSCVPFPGWILGTVTLCGELPLIRNETITKPDEDAVTQITVRFGFPQPRTIRSDVFPRHQQHPTGPSRLYSYGHNYSLSLNLERTELH